MASDDHAGIDPSMTLNVLTCRVSAFDLFSALGRVSGRERR